MIPGGRLSDSWRHVLLLPEAGYLRPESRLCDSWRQIE